MDERRIYESIYAVWGDIGPGSAKDLNEFRVILVTGPQRSGTTFMAKAIASDMDRPFVDEAAFGVGNVELFMGMVEGASHCVIQCPTMMKYVHDVPDDVLVVVMLRNPSDIQRSQERIGWDGDHSELERYPERFRTSTAAETKYAWWHHHKWNSPSYYIEVPYERMKDHPLWVDKGSRAGFGPKQTEVRK